MRRCSRRTCSSSVASTRSTRPALKPARSSPGREGWCCSGAPPLVAGRRVPVQWCSRLAEGCAVPGLCDAHGHVVWLARALEEVDCRGATAAGCASLRRGARPDRTRGSWIRGRGWDENCWPGGELPTAALLDAVLPDHKALFTRGWPCLLGQLRGPGGLPDRCGHPQSTRRSVGPRSGWPADRRAHRRCPDLVLSRLLAVGRRTGAAHARPASRVSLGSGSASDIDARCSSSVVRAYAGSPRR